MSKRPGPRDRLIHYDRVLSGKGVLSGSTHHEQTGPVIKITTLCDIIKAVQIFYLHKTGPVAIGNMHTI